MRKRITSNQRQEYVSILYANGYDLDSKKSDYYSSVFTKFGSHKSDIIVTIGKSDRTVEIVVYSEGTQRVEARFSSYNGILVRTKEFKTLVEKL